MDLRFQKLFEVYNFKEQPLDEFTLEKLSKFLPTLSLEVQRNNKTGNFRERERS